MKKRYFNYGILIMLSFISSCKKNFTESKSHSPIIIQNAENYFNSEILSKKLSEVDSLDINSLSFMKSPRQKADKKPDWNLAYITHLKSGSAVVVPVVYKKPFIVTSNFDQKEVYNINTLTKLLIYQDVLKHYHAELITAFPDSTYKQQSKEAFKGLLFVDDWWGNPINKYKFEKDQPVTVFKNRNSVEKKEGQRSNDIYVCYDIYGYNYGIGSDTVYWSEPAGCSYLYGGGSPVDYNNPYPTPSGGEYGGLPTLGKDSGLTVPLQPLNVAIYNGNNNIKDAKQYWKCFTNNANPDHSYAVRLCVDQPAPDNDKTWGWNLNVSNPIVVGHVFFVLTESSSSQTISRSVGFYPTYAVSPFSLTAQGVLNNDEIHDYNVSLSISLNNEQFFNLLNVISKGNDPGYLYNLNSNNCTTFALDALSSIGINSIPRTEGTWIFSGKGLNPGNLGEDLRTMPLSPNMTRTSISGSHFNIGICN